ncbi:hypothetical protein AB0C38_47105 [Amycolatopsis sp. NPDC048633]|uniref:hypothetical protein n=1 Tax=Amycolatopsis sp. NPDC048633 TaxID=3157095 RepID=UPI0034009786
MPQLADEPKVTDWLSVWFSLGSAVIALLALVAAGIAVRATVATNRTQSEQLRRLEEAATRDRAAKFAVWALPPVARPQVFFRNGAPTPMYDVVIRFTLNGVDAFVHSAGTLPPSEEPQPLPDVAAGLHDAIRARALADVEFEALPEPPDASAFDSDLLMTPEWQRYQRDRAPVDGRNERAGQAALEEFTAAMELAMSVTFNDGESSWVRTADGRLRPGPR